MTKTLDVNPASSSTQSLVGDYSAFIGRGWFFEELETWLSAENPPHWMVTAEPGWGKSVLAREIVRRIPGAVNRPDEVSKGTRLLVLEGVKPEWQRFTCPVLLFSRPQAGLERAQIGGIRWTHQDPTSDENLADIREYLQAHDPEVLAQILRGCGGNFLVAAMLSQMLPDADREAKILEVLWDIVVDVVKAAPSESHADLYRMLCLVAEAGEPLATAQFVDFLGISAARTQELLASLRPILAPGRVHQLFNPLVARTVSLKLTRDMEGTHASVIAFFRETYPSWEEMSDSYGWHHLGHHCDRYARTGKKLDFSSLHWLTEGPYIRIKLGKTRALLSTLQDVRRGLEAALQDWDLPRIVSYGFQLPRTRREMTAPLIHELADQGELLRAGQHVALLAQESSRYLAYILLAWQAADERQFEWMRLFLAHALVAPPPELETDDLPLVTSACAALLKIVPQNEEFIFRLLDLEENPVRAARNYLQLGLQEGLSPEFRHKALHLGKTRSRLLNSDQQKLAHFIDRCLKFGQSENPEPLDEEGFVAKVATSAKDKVEARAVDALVELCIQSLEIEPRPDWLGARLPLLVGVVGQVRSLAERFRGLMMLSRLFVRLGGDEWAQEVLEKLASVAIEFDDLPYRSRALAEVGVAFHMVGQRVRSNQLISLSAALAFQEAPASKSQLLKYAAGAAALLGHSIRARDLAYNALEVTETGDGQATYFEIHCRGAVKQAVLANISAERSLEMLHQYADNCNQEDLDPKIKALSLAAVAESAHRLGYSSEAHKWVETAINLARSQENAMERSFLMARLASSLHLLGERSRYEALLQESMEALLLEPDRLLRVEALMTLVEVRHEARDPRAHDVEKTLVRELSALNSFEVLHSRTLLRLAQAKQKGHIASDVQNLFDRARAAMENAPAVERDAAVLHHIRLELALGFSDAALALLSKLTSTRRRATALADISEALILDQPQEAIRWLQEIPLRQERLSAILRCTTRLAGDLRPSRQRSLHLTMAQLTVLASEDEATIDVLLSRWIQNTTDSRLLERTARKMGWLNDEPSPPQPPLGLRKPN